MRRRTRSREIALQMLYQVDARGSEALEDLEAFLDREAFSEPEVRAFAKELVEGTIEHIDEIDGVLQRAAQNWKIDRMAFVDRNVLRMAIFELLHRPDVPSKVTINEAIELGKRYSTQQSGAFINGILDRIRREREPA